MKARETDRGWGLVAVWTVVAAVVLLIQSWLFETSFLPSLLSLPGLFVFGIATLGAMLALRSWKAAAAFAVLTVVLVLLPLGALGHQAWTRISFAQHRPAYERIVAQTGSLPDRGRVEGEAYIKDQKRIAFPRSHGMPDGWSGVVYDPTDTMPLEKDRHMFVFGSNTQSCIRIERGWYRCWFD
jgi:hypothetical protein